MTFRILVSPVSADSTISRVLKSIYNAAITNWFTLTGRPASSLAGHRSHDTAVIFGFARQKIDLVGDRFNSPAVSIGKGGDVYNRTCFTFQLVEHQVTYGPSLD